MERATATPRVMSAAGSAWLSLLLLVAGSFAGWAAPSPPKSEPPPREAPASSTLPASDDSAKIKAALAEAEELYAKGYALSEEGKALVKEGKAGDAKKKFSKALKQFEAALERNENHYPSWNMVGYCSRHLGDLKKAFAAYNKCLAIAPDYDEAHEYLGEAYLLAGDIANAKVQLAWLRAHDSDEADELAEKIAKVAPAAAASTQPPSASDSAQVK